MNQHKTPNLKFLFFLSFTRFGYFQMKMLGSSAFIVISLMP